MKHLDGRKIRRFSILQTQEAIKKQGIEERVKTLYALSKKKEQEIVQVKHRLQVCKDILTQNFDNIHNSKLCLVMNLKSAYDFSSACGSLKKSDQLRLQGLNFKNKEILNQVKTGREVLLMIKKKTQILTERITKESGIYRAMKNSLEMLEIEENISFQRSVVQIHQRKLKEEML